jgi:hypothetical protein
LSPGRKRSDCNPISPFLTLSFRTEQADFFFRVRSCERVGLRREESLFASPLAVPSPEPLAEKLSREHFYADFKIRGDFQKDAAERADFQWTMRGDCNLVF